MDASFDGLAGFKQRPVLLKYILGPFECAFHGNDKKEYT
jgi:hypothetical protein